MPLKLPVKECVESTVSERSEVTKSGSAKDPAVAGDADTKATGVDN